MHFIFRRPWVTYSSTKVWNLLWKLIKTTELNANTHSFHIGHLGQQLSRVNGMMFTSQRASGSIYASEKAHKASHTYRYVWYMCCHKRPCELNVVIWSVCYWLKICYVCFWFFFFHLHRKPDKIALPCYYTNIYALTEAFGFIEMYFLLRNWIQCRLPAFVQRTAYSDYMCNVAT